MTEPDRLRVLVVEDEYFLADDLKKVLAGAGMAVVGPVATMAEAMALLEEAPVDCAILDINLRGHRVYPLAQALRDSRVPFLFISGYDMPAVDAGFDDVRLIRKPFDADDVIQAVYRLTSGQRVRDVAA